MLGLIWGLKSDSTRQNSSPAFLLHEPHKITAKTKNKNKKWTPGCSEAPDENPSEAALAHDNKGYIYMASFYTLNRRILQGSHRLQVKHKQFENRAKVYFSNLT